MKACEDVRRSRDSSSLSFESYNLHESARIQGHRIQDCVVFGLPIRDSLCNSSKLRPMKPFPKLDVTLILSSEE
jgi:hypothetical protein